MKKIIYIVLCTYFIGIIVTGCSSNNILDSTNIDTSNTSETVETTTQAKNDSDENDGYSYEQLKIWRDKALKALPPDSWAEMYPDKDKNVLVVGITNESYRESVEEKLKEINDKYQWYEIIISEGVKPD